MLYHEKQVAALCGVHCLNTLLQGPYFNEIDLAQIAHNLDELERALVTDGGLGESGNVAMDGMFSIQVLSRALESWGLQVVSLESEAAREHKAAPTSADAFICNLSEHWFTLRKVATGDWWNFNSLFPAPQPLSTFYLQAFLDTLREEGWTIFVVTGQLPATQPGSLDQVPNAPGRWWTPEEARAATDEAERARKRGRVAAALESALARADQQGGKLQLRTRGAPATTLDDSDGGGDDDDDADLAAAIAASLQSYSGAGASGSQPQAQALQPPPRPQEQQQQQQQGAGPSGTPAADLPYGGMYDEDDDAELAMAIAASLADSAAATAATTAAATAATTAAATTVATTQEGGGGDGAGGDGGGGGQAEALLEAQQEVGPADLGPEPEEGEGVIEVAFRLPSGDRCSRRFPLAAPSSSLFAFLGPSLGVPPAQIALSTTFPKKELVHSPTTTLAELGLSNRTLLVAELARR